MSDWKEKKEKIEKAQMEHTVRAATEGTFGKLPPQSREMERAVLGALMVDKDSIGDVSVLKPEHFYEERHSLIFKAMLQLHFNNEPIDMLTVNQQLSKNGNLADVGGAFYLVELTNHVASAANIEHHARIIVAKYMLRKVIETGSVLIKKGFDPESDPFELVQEAETELFNIINGVQENNYSTAQEMGLKVYQNAKKKHDSGSDLSGERFTDIYELDKMISGAEIGDVIGIAGSPSSGKSSIVNAILRYLAKVGRPGLMWSGEMSKEKSTARLASAISGIATRRIQQGKFLDDEEETKIVMKVLAELPDNIYLQSEEKNIKKIISDVKRFKRKGVDLFIYDRSELIEVDYSNSKDLNAYGKTLATMRKVAVSEGVTFIVLVQTTKELEKDHGIPSIGNIYGGTAVTSSFNKIIGLVNPFVLGMQDWPTKFSHIAAEAGVEKVKGYLMLNIVKSNDGDDLERPVIVRFDQHSNTISSLIEAQVPSAINSRTGFEDFDGVPF